MVNYRHSGEELDPGRWPALAAHVSNLWDRPAFQAMLADEQKLIDIARSR